jgi:hypothetical protein
VDVRTGWAREDALLSFLCDVYPAGGHRQADRNQFSLHALRESFAIDSGYGLETMADTTEVLRRGAMGEAHNLPLVHGRMQERGQVTGDGIVRADTDGVWAYIESEAGQSYGAGWRFRRRVLCLPGAGSEMACVLLVDRLSFQTAESRPMLSWLLHTAAGNDIDLERDYLTLIGRRTGSRCRVHMVSPWPGRWKCEDYLGHPRLRYDWFWDHLMCLVVLAPYDGEGEPPQIESEGSASGCAVTIGLPGGQYTAMTAGPGQRCDAAGLSTDAELAVVWRRDGQVRGQLLSEGTYLSAGGQQLIHDPEGVEHVTQVGA